jgi:hypothetical protein
MKTINVSMLAAEVDMATGGSSPMDPLKADWLLHTDKIGFLFLLSIICLIAFFGKTVRTSKKFNVSFK